MSSDVGKLEEQALKRKQRLTAMRNKQQESQSDSQPMDVDEPGVLPK